MRAMLAVTILVLPILAGCVDEGAMRAACTQLAATYVPPTGDAEPLAVVQRRNQIKAQYDASCSAFGTIDAANAAVQGSLTPAGRQFLSK